MRLPSSMLSALLLTTALIGQAPPFTGNTNRPDRTGVGKVAFVVVGYSDVSEQGFLIDVATQLSIARDLETVIERNSYGRRTTLVSPRPGESLAPFRVVMPKPVAYYKTRVINHPEDFVIHFQLDVLVAMQLAGGDPLDYESVLFLAGDDDGGAAKWVTNCNQPFAVEGFKGLGGSGGPQHVLMAGANARAPAYAHELGHVWGSGHANCWRSAVPSPTFFEMSPTSAGALAHVGEPNPTGGPPNPLVPALFSYGDPFDYMGLGGGCAPRLCRAGEFPDDWAAETDIHDGLIRKWQQNWLTDDEVAVVHRNLVWPGVYTARIHSIASQGLPSPLPVDEFRGLEIPRGHTTPEELTPYGTWGERVPESIFVSYRGHEPRSRNGITISYGTKERARLRTRTVRYQRFGSPGPALGLCGNPCGTTSNYDCEDPSKKMPCDDSSLFVGEVFRDPYTDVYISPVAVDPDHRWVDVAVTFGAAAVDITNEHTPIAHVTSPNLPPDWVIGPQGIGPEGLEVELRAYDPDHNPSNPQMWDNIVSVEYFVKIPPLNGQPTPSLPEPWIHHGTIAAPQGGPITLKLDLSKQTVQAIAQQKLPGTSFDEAQRYGTFNAHFRTAEGNVIPAGFAFLINYLE